jgi:hypothetical protein
MKDENIELGRASKTQSYALSLKLSASRAKTKNKRAKHLNRDAPEMEYESKVKSRNTYELGVKDGFATRLNSTSPKGQEAFLLTHVTVTSSIEQVEETSLILVTSMSLKYGHC